MTSYEELLRRIATMPSATRAGSREVRWLTSARVLGVARTPEGQIEIFLRGPALIPSSLHTRDALQFGPWYGSRGGDPAFNANRLILPSEGHFDQVAAFICVELLRNRVEEDFASGFRTTEPLVALLLERLRSSDRAVIGLTGELIVLSALLKNAPAPAVSGLIEAWHGWKRSLRDVTVGPVGVEVKTTTRTLSSHQIHGTHQVDVASGNASETGLVLVSVGLNRSDAHHNTVAMPDLIESVLQRMREVGSEEGVAKFLARVKEYGSDSGLSYDHLTMSTDPAFKSPFEVTFVRGYDMSDPNMSVLRGADVATHHHVDAGSLSYTINLPAKVTGDINPVQGLQPVVRAILTRAGWIA